VTEKVPPEVQHQLLKLQQLQAQLNKVVSERRVVETELREAERVLKSLGELGENPVVYKAVGGVLIKSEKTVLEQEYGDKKEILELRLKKLKEQEELLKNQLNQVQRKIREF